jgi:glycine N-methyltransferase
MLAEAFSPKSQSKIYGDFKPLAQIKDPAFFIHVVEKPKN